MEGVYKKKKPRYRHIGTSVKALISMFKVLPSADVQTPLTF